MREIKVRTSQRPRPLPSGRWALTQRWNDLLLAHWRVPASCVAALLPQGLLVDTFQGSAWLGVVPFWVDQLKFRGVPSVLGIRSFPELNLRTYVRDQQTGSPGLYSFSVDAGSLLAVAAMRLIFNLPYRWAEMRFSQRAEREFAFYSRRRLSGSPVMFKARYRGLGPTRRLAEMRSGSLEYFLTERHCLFIRNGAGQMVRTNIHMVSSPMEDAEAEIDHNDLASAIGIHLPPQDPVFYYSRRLAVYVWPTELVRPLRVPRRAPAMVAPSG
ncbi:MAG TPA: DUF2071 domain-containing protein [Terracidiphilus sp.]|nr:DUF2071 domain-containing protein [Terracidiphilus sp.]